MTHIGQTESKIDPLGLGEQAPAITLSIAFLTPVLDECAYRRRRGIVLLTLFLQKAEYRKAEECENDNEARNLEEENS